MSSEKTVTAAAAPAEATQSAPDVSLQLMTFIEVYKKQIIIVILLGALAGTANYVITANKKQKEVAAATALAMVDLNASVASTPGMPGQPKAEDYFKVATDHAGTTAAEQALLRGAVALFEADKFTEAQQKFEEFAAKYPESISKPTAELGVAACLEGQKQLDKAAEAYQRVITSYSTQIAGNQAKLALGAVHEQKGQFAQALKLYDELATVRPNTAPSGWANEASMRKERLLEAHPELAAPAAAPAAAVAPVKK